MTERGFITIATGKKHYYAIAANLLKSYRIHSNNPLPFAVIAEEENEYTALFDDVIITTESKHSFIDKFLLLKLCPYQETIFFDSDCLAYGDLNKYWTFFENATDFSSIGCNYDLSDNNGAWYNLDGICKYGTMIQYKTHIHAGVIYIRKTTKLKKLYEDCMTLLNEFNSLTFHTCPESTDECILGVAMPLNGMKATREKANMLACYPVLTKLHCNMLTGTLSYSTPWGGFTENGILIHWGTSQTKKALYRFEVESMTNYLSKDHHSFVETIMYKYRFRYFVLRLPELPRNTLESIKQYIYKMFKKSKRIHNSIAEN